MQTAEIMQQTVADMLKGIERFNPENLPTLEEYVEIQVRENAYDLEANLAVLKLYQLDPMKFSTEITSQILIKALTNFPHTDFVLCKCLLNEKNLQEPEIAHINFLADILERCNFQQFWAAVRSSPEVVAPVLGFHDSIRKFVCHVVGITYQTIEAATLAALLGGVDDQTLRMWMKKYGWKDIGNNMIFIANQEDNIKTKNITEKIDFDSVSPIMAASL
ncbi:eukaryotic translation initiation factor 3 subunit K [Ischnura elegans]|uniref:eukaryotic translation initiation factor 3 subunit K n=1 Tax=Ischnura elegans TaxID=197161 RepID=UPI001ED86E44|nr:eukaryotic translation initiation factor 3 subunit K [Ischnura elegans]XP_046389130.1 eukaryotic translation initiation factor 3 subunit K [Ischnura elegans]